MKIFLQLKLLAIVALSIPALFLLLFFRISWLDILLAIITLAGVLLILYVILKKKNKTETEEKFLGNHQSFESLVSTINDYAIFLLDIKGRVVSWNKGAENMKGFTQRDILGKQSDLFYTEEDLQEGLPQNNLRLTLQSGHLETEGWRLRKNRSAFYADIVFTALYDEKKKHYGYAVVTKDITKRKKTEADLLALNDELENRVIEKTAGIYESEKKYRHTMDNMLEGIQIHDQDWRYTYVNQAVIKSGHYSNTELLGYTLMEKYPGIEQTELFKTLQRCMNERIALHFETAFIFPDGTQKDFQLSIQPVPEGLFILSIDISAQKKAAEKLFKSEENYRSIMERVSDGFVAIDKNWEFTYINKKGGSILQRRPEELVAKNIWTEFPAGLDRSFYQACHRAMNEQKYTQVDAYYPSSDSWVENHIYPSADGLSVFFRDITVRKKAEQQREFDESNMYALINNTNDLMWSVARDLTLITSNKAFEDMVKQLSGAVIEHGNAVLGKGFSLGQLQTFKAFYERAFAGETFSTEHSGFNGDTWSEISFHPIYEGGVVMGTACSSRDITERKIAEELMKDRLQEKKALAARMRTIINTIPASIALLNDKGYIIDVNDTWRNDTNNVSFIGNRYGVGDDYLGGVKNATGEQKEDGQEVAKGLASVLDNKVKEFFHEYTCETPATKKCFRMIASPLPDKESAGAVVMHIDITELRRLEKEKLDGKIEQQKSITRAMLEAQEKERNHLGLELHDNVSQLLAAIQMKLRLAISGKMVDVEMVKECIEHVEETVEETRNLSHRMVMPRFADSSFLDAIALLAVDYRNPSRSIRLETAGFNESKVLPGIKETLYRILQEQLNNIEKYAQASSVLILTNTENAGVSMVITDNGIGFNTTRKKNGIGLENIRNRAESYNGNVIIESAPGKGCVISIYIPLSAANEVTAINV